jgi:hypothetical protein
MKWFRYGQNNSGGHMERNSRVADYVFIEAQNGVSADMIAEDLGIYFNGVEDGNDCECCGDRWNSCRWDKGVNTPDKYALEYGENGVRIYPYGARNPVSIADFQKNPPMVIEPS